MAKTEFINLINGLKTLNAPIDAAGCQSHDLNDMAKPIQIGLGRYSQQIQIPINYGV